MSVSSMDAFEERLYSGLLCYYCESADGGDYYCWRMATDSSADECYW